MVNNHQKTMRNHKKPSKTIKKLVKTIKIISSQLPLQIQVLKKKVPTNTQSDPSHRIRLGTFACNLQLSLLGFSFKRELPLSMFRNLELGGDTIWKLFLDIWIPCVLFGGTLGGHPLLGSLRSLRGPKRLPKVIIKRMEKDGPASVSAPRDAKSGPKVPPGVQSGPKKVTETS